MIVLFFSPSDRTFYSAAHGSTANRPGLARFRRIGGDSAGDRRERLACRARVVSIDLHARLTCCFPRDLKLTGNLVSGLEVHLIWRLATKCRMWKTCIVLFDIERDEFLNRADCIERVQIELLMFEHATPGDMPNLVGMGGTNADFWFGGMNTFAWSPPVVNPDQPVPGRRRGEDESERQSREASHERSHCQIAAFHIACTNRLGFALTHAKDRQRPSLMGYKACSRYGIP